jgi:peroxiredoxin family protein
MAPRIAIAGAEQTQFVRVGNAGRSPCARAHKIWPARVGPRLERSRAVMKRIVILGAGTAMMAMKKSMTELELPSVREMQILDESGADLYGCELAMKMFKRTKDELVPQVKEVITAGDFYDLSVGAQIIFT